MQRDTDLMKMSQSDLISTWQTTIEEGVRARTDLEEEESKRTRVKASSPLVQLM